MVNKRAQMMANKRRKYARKKAWKDLSPSAKFGTLTAAAVQLSLLVAAQTDITRRPANQIRGSKAMWRVATLINFVGPGSYFTFGVKRHATAK
jgi:hypothetical protein